MNTTNRTAEDTPPQELARYRELLEPLEQMATSGKTTLPADEQNGWEQAKAALRSDLTDPVEIEEVIATFARAMWTAPGWVEPPARIARALLQRAEAWPEPERGDAIAIAQRFADRASRVDHADLQARLATTHAKLALGDLAAAEKAAAILPSRDPAALAVRADIAARRERWDEACRLRTEQLAAETDRAEQRHARLQLALLHRAAGDLDQALAALRDNLAEYPDWAAGRHALGLIHRQRGELLDAFAELENAVLLGRDDVRAELDDVAAELDRDALAGFRSLLRASQDGDELVLCPAADTAADAAGAES